ncbi:hypothetical protein EVAR_29406_1 [Eumeta japonica]|uniref:Uncharacterized protein n=1 Tax=Eumeta variegata TaxID=151549 RepID=A0A4C1VTL7_EUMVA|nr:hypothetical protein EVAR_29406_1 [Eumeta japonica]
MIRGCRGEVINTGKAIEYVMTRAEPSLYPSIKEKTYDRMNGETRKDRCRNSDVRERCVLKENEVTKVERGMLRWFGHLERMNKNRLTEQIYRANASDGKVDKGHLRKSYVDHIGGMVKKG